MVVTGALDFNLMLELFTKAGMHIPLNWHFNKLRRGEKIFRKETNKAASFFNLSVDDPKSSTPACPPAVPLWPILAGLQPAEKGELFGKARQGLQVRPRQEPRHNRNRFGPRIRARGKAMDELQGFQTVEPVVKTAKEKRRIPKVFFKLFPVCRETILKQEIPKLCGDPRCPGEKVLPV